MQESLVDSEDDYPLPFDSPNDLLEIFTALEDRNLNLIQRTQENEKTIEEKKILLDQQKKIYSDEVSKLKEREDQVALRSKKV